MKKKNVIGHMTAPKEKMSNWFCRLELLPRLICLILAILIWLTVVDVTSLQEKEDFPSLPTNAESEIPAE